MIDGGGLLAAGKQISAMSRDGTDLQISAMWQLMRPAISPGAKSRISVRLTVFLLGLVPLRSLAPYAKSVNALLTAWASFLLLYSEDHLGPADRAAHCMSV